MKSNNPILAYQNNIASRMATQCLAITKAGKQCKIKKTGKLFCTLHTKNNPVDILLDGDSFQKIMKYTTEEQYYKMLNKISQTLDKTIIKNIKINESDNKCIVCFEKLDNPDNIINCSNLEHNHQVCIDCLNGHILSMLNDGIASTECMFDKADKCGGCYKESDFKKCLVNEDIYSKWTETSICCEIIKLASICDNYLICPLCCKWGCIFDAPPGVGNRHAFYIPCGKCGEQWCTLCKRKSHGNQSCYELHFTDNENQDARTKTIDKLLQDITTRVLTHCCTICGCTYIKEEGCNLMTCPKCNGMSCYICGMKLYMKNNTKYWHFTGHDLSDRNANCPLWNNTAGDGKANQGNTAYNMGLVEKEFIDFINANKNIAGGNDIIKLIKLRINKLFGKDKDYRDIITRIVRTGKEN